jgi:hypothetical protein
MKDCNYRNLEKPPVPLHAIDTALVQSMHREIHALYGVLADICGKVNGLDGIEERIRKRLEESDG